MLKLNITNRNGELVSVVAAANQTLMEVLRNRGDVEGLCGGQRACATCHVHIDTAWMGVVGEPGEEEAALLDFSMEKQSNSRLSCQIDLLDAMDGLALTVAAAEG
ncbi:MAG: 2Fe-2S iron-sulfur cluster binding domain-containing protein [Gammaproteobacteria bacterium]|nr:2Fe-2S iron-sulfur cluster binding domain-containing protein [Gammaproteobacteria bacterium]